MPTINAIGSNIPIELSKGGTNATSFSTSDGILKYDGTRLVSSSTAKLDSSNRMTNTAQPAFLAQVDSDIDDVTGDGTNYTIVFDTESFDQGSDFDGVSTFTAPVTGKYLFISNITPTNLSSSWTLGYFDVVTTNATYRYLSNAGAALHVNFRCNSIKTFCSMTAGDTATFVLTISGSTKTVDIQGNAGTGGYILNIACSTLIC